MKRMQRAKMRNLNSRELMGHLCVADVLLLQNTRSLTANPILSPQQITMTNVTAATALTSMRRHRAQPQGEFARDIIL
jgi:hypothetical protein